MNSVFVVWNADVVPNRIVGIFSLKELADDYIEHNENICLYVKEYPLNPVVYTPDIKTVYVGNSSVDMWDIDRETQAEKFGY